MIGAAAQLRTAHQDASTTSATRLPDAAFSLLAYQAMEDAAIWSRFWVCIGFEAEIPNAGDVLPFTVGHQGMHVERAADGSLVGRFNKAQHGGCRVVPLQCRTGTKTRCSFTACGYSRDRGPIHAAEAKAAAQLDQYLGLRPERLLPVTTATQGPLLFARLDPRGENEERVMPAPLVSLERDGRQPSSATIWREVVGNWKAVAIGLAARYGDEVESSFPNAIVRRTEVCTTVAIVQPVALERTLCRFRVYGRGPVQGGRSEATVDALLQRLRLHGGEGAKPLFRDADFENAVAGAIDALSAHEPTNPLFQTSDKGRW